jgi:hypothetical protein
VQRAPGIPHALLFFGAKVSCITPGAIAPRDRGVVSCRHCEERSDEAIRTSVLARWLASRSLSSGARSRDPLARNDGFTTSRHSGAARGAEPGIHNHDREYGFRARAEPVIGPRFARTHWRAPGDFISPYLPILPRPSCYPRRSNDAHRGPRRRVASIPI